MINNIIIIGDPNDWDSIKQNWLEPILFTSKKFKGDDMDRALRDVKYYNDSFYYRIDCKNKKVLLNKKGHLKKCLIIDVTSNKMYNGKKQFLIDNSQYNKMTDEELVYNILNNIKFKVFKKIKIRLY